MVQTFNKLRTPKGKEYNFWRKQRNFISEKREPCKLYLKSLRRRHISRCNTSSDEHNLDKTSITTGSHKKLIDCTQKCLNCAIGSSLFEFTQVWSLPSLRLYGVAQFLHILTYIHMLYFWAETFMCLLIKFDQIFKYLPSFARVEKKVAMHPDHSYTNRP